MDRETANAQRAMLDEHDEDRRDRQRAARRAPLDDHRGPDGVLGNDYRDGEELDRAEVAAVQAASDEELAGELVEEALAELRDRLPNVELVESSVLRHVITVVYTTEHDRPAPDRGTIKTRRVALYAAGEFLTTLVLDDVR